MQREERNMDYSNMTLMELCKLPGVEDIQPLKARAAFGKALKEEALGHHEAAEALLNEACQAEER
jgi:hypothetical protein